MIEVQISCLGNPFEVGGILVQNQGWKKPVATVLNKVVRFYIQNEKIPYLHNS